MTGIRVRLSDAVWIAADAKHLETDQSQLLHTLSACNFATQTPSKTSTVSPTVNAIRNLQLQTMRRGTRRAPTEDSTDSRGLIDDVILPSLLQSLMFVRQTGEAAATSQRTTRGL